MSEKPGQSGNRDPLRIGVVGGSIAGCAAAIVLSRAGHDVTVFERSTGELQGRGAGIGTPLSVIEMLIAKDMIDADFPYFNVHRIPHIARSSGDEPLGRMAWNIPATIELLNWGDLYRNLRRRVPDEIYLQGKQVMEAENNDDQTVTLGLGDGSSETFDLVLFADGYRSMGREHVCDKSLLTYRDYVLWRGVLPESELEDSAPLEGMLNRVRYPDGHGVFYFVPGENGSVEPGKRWVNWAIYVRVPKEELPVFLVDKDGRQRRGSLPPGSIRQDLVDALTTMVSEQFPPYYADIVTASQNTFVQPIYTAQVSGYKRGRMALLGDAGAMAQPFTAGGVFKGMNNAIDLAEALDNYDSVDEALAAWSATETATGQRMYALGQQLEQALIWNIPDFSTMDEDAMRDWWTAAAKMPEDLFASDERSRPDRPA